MKFRRGVIIAVAKDANFSVGDPEHETIGLYIYIYIYKVLS